MSRYDYADPGTDSEYCDALTSEAEAEPPDHSLADVSRVDRIIARLRGEEWYTYRDTSNMVWIWGYKCGTPDPDHSQIAFRPLYSYLVLSKTNALRE